MIAVERVLRGLVLLAAGVYLVGHVNADYGSLAERVMRAVELDPHRPFLHRIVVRLHKLRVHELLAIGIAALGYGGLELVEGVGLWLDQLWAEYLTAMRPRCSSRLSCMSWCIRQASGRRSASASISRSSPISSGS